MKILCIGYYGYGLVGDEAILAVLVRDLRTKFPDADICVTSANAKVTQSEYNVSTIQIDYLSEVISAIRASHLVIVGGGGLFTEYSKYQPTSSLRGTIAFNTLCAEAPAFSAAMGVPCVILGAGVEPQVSREAIAATRSAFLLATRATVRDQFSQMMLRSIEGERISAVVTCDVAATLHPEPLDRQQILRDLALDPNQPLLTLSMRHWDCEPQRLSPEAQEWEEAAAAGLTRFARERKLQVLAIPHQNEGAWIYSNDADFYDRFLPKLGGVPSAIWRGPLLPRLVMSLQAFGDIHLAMRHHGVILSIATCTPCVAVAYSPKVAAAMKDAGLEQYCLPLEGLTAQSLFASLQDAWGSRKAIRKRMAIVGRKRTALHAKALKILWAALRPAASTKREMAMRSAISNWLALGAGADPADPFVLGVEAHLRSLAAQNQPFHVHLQALKILSRARPELGFLKYYLGIAYLSSGVDDHAAIDAFTESIRLEYLPAWSFSMRAEAKERIGDLDGATSDNLMAINLDEKLSRSIEALERIGRTEQRGS